MTQFEWESIKKNNYLSIPKRNNFFLSLDITLQMVWSFFVHYLNKVIDTYSICWKLHTFLFNKKNRNKIYCLNVLKIYYEIRFGNHVFLAIAEQPLNGALFESMVKLKLERCQFSFRMKSKTIWDVKAGKNVVQNSV